MIWAASTLLATETPKFIAPAMNVHMYENKRTQQNINILKEDGYHFIEPGSGFLACGYVARMYGDHCFKSFLLLMLIFKIVIV